MHRTRTPIVALAAFALAVSLQALSAQDAPAKASKIDWKETEAPDFAAKLDKASAAGEKWAQSPESIILEYVGPFISKEGEKAAAKRSIRIFTKGDELPKTLNVVLIDDGLLDDSIKTAQTRLALARQEDGTWKLRKAYKAQVKWPKPGS